jgi:hypothetical protein
MQPSIPTSPQLSEQNLRELAEARKSLRKVGRAVSVARFDGWTIAIFAGLTFLMGVTDPGNILMALGLGTAAYFELTGASRLRRLDGSAIRMLGFNQFGLAALLTVYALWRIHVELSVGGMITKMIPSDQMDAQVLGPLGNVVENLRPLVIAFYGTVIAVAILGMGAMAWFYFSRRKYLEAYLTQTPEWIIAMQKTGLTL